MIIRLTEIIIILAVIIGGLWYIFNTAIVKPRKESEQSIKKVTDKAIYKARIDYLEIRKAWINYSLQESVEFFATSMSDMTIPEVARFQKMMVTMNEKYEDLPEDVEPDVMFVAKVTALRSAFNDAVLEAKKREL